MINIKKVINLIYLLMVLPVQAEFFLPIVSIAELMRYYPQIQYQKCHDETCFEYIPFPLSIDPESHPNKGYFKENFIATIPNGTVQSYGLVLAGDIFIEELIWKGFVHNLEDVQQFSQDQIFHVSGKVAVIGQAAFYNYWHWTTEVLCRLAMLELQGIEYDYLYVPQANHFMQETLRLWGIHPSKIYVASGDLCVQAEQLIVPSLVSNMSFKGVIGACYVQMYLLEYVKNKLLNAALKQKSSKEFSKRVFISRKDAPQRKIINEEMVFELFAEKGFERHELGKLSISDQILLFHNAEIIVSPQGTGLTNIIYCKPNTCIVELLQGLNDCTFWYLSQDLNLNYTPVKTTKFISDYVSAWGSNTYMPLSIIKKVIENLNL